MTVLDEAAHLAESVGSLQRQDWAGDLQIVIALGPSADGTGGLAAKLARADNRIELVENPSGRTPSGLNKALALARHPVIVRVDGHCVLPPDYISRAVSILQETGAANVGGIMAAVGTTTFERAVAVAMRSKLGVGAAPFHVGGSPGPAETVYLGVFRHDSIAAAGGYDEAFDRAQDWELNHRIREAGGLVWFTPELSVTYRPRSSPGALSRQYFNYGRWRREIMRRHRGTVRLRYLAAPAAVALMAAGAAVGAIGVLGRYQVLRVGWLVPIGYVVSMAVGGWTASAGEPVGVRLQVPATLATMHCSWGVGFLRGLR